MKQTAQSFELSKSAIQNGSRSFSIASLFLNRDTKISAFCLYRWCRFCDDLIDNATDANQMQQSLHELREQTQLALEGKIKDEHSAFFGLCELQKQYAIPARIFFELLEGFQLDAEGKVIYDLEDLEKYCYHVAGVVGLLMSRILGASSPEALLCADELGRAMQLTNICRDIQEDFKINRIYIPQLWLQEKGVEKANLLLENHRAALWSLTERVLQLADKKYEIGRKGLLYLPFRAGLSICIASFLYQQIGHKLKRKGPQGLNQRTILTAPEKLSAVIHGAIVFHILIFKSKFQTSRKRSVTQ